MADLVIITLNCHSWGLPYNYKHKSFNDETTMSWHTQTQWYNNHRHGGFIRRLKSKLYSDEKQSN